MKTPSPRQCPCNLEHGNTWVEAEEFSYPNGGMYRRGYVRWEDGELRSVLCGIPDTFFSIPAVGKIHGIRVKGYVTCRDGDYDKELVFIIYKKQGKE
jgi:hypothetical protein